MRKLMLAVVVGAIAAIVMTAAPSDAKACGKGKGNNPCPTNTPSPTATLTSTPSPSPTASPTPSPTPTATPTPLPVRAAVIDSGCQWEHVGLQGRINIGLGYTAPWLVNTNVGVGQDDSYDGHGTKVCGIIAGAARNIIDEPLGGGTNDVVPIKAFSAWGQCADVAGPDVDGMVAAINYAVAQGARLVNISCTSRLYSQSIQDAINAGFAQNVLFVVAAGNGSTFDDTQYPVGARDNMLVVGGGQGSPEPWVQSTRSSYVDIVADAMGTISTSCVHDYVNAGTAPCDVTWNENPLGIPVGTPYYEAGSGTSFATPLVTHTLIAMLKANPALTASQLEAIIKSTATPMPNCPVGCGAGYLNPVAAIAAAQQ